MNYTNKKYIFYLMHINWNWAKQRPHFISEKINEFIPTIIFYPIRFNLLNKNFYYKKISKNVIGFYLLPFQRFNKYKIYRFISNISIFYQLKIYFINSSYVWLNSAIHFEIFHKKISNKQYLIYDCMDDFLEFQAYKNNNYLFNKFLKFEKLLLSNSNIVFASSETLKCKLIERYGDYNNIYVINNALSKGFNSNIKIEEKSVLPFSKNSYNILYVGTISHWFDFEILIKSLKFIKNINYYLIGPSEVIIPHNNNITSFGQIEHDDIHYFINQCDLLIMPFKLSNLVLSVDPVKIYEYISSQKPILTINYPEIDKFQDLVFKYTTHEEYLSILNMLIQNKNNPINLLNRNHFLDNNTWDNRISLILIYFKLNNISNYNEN